jgi:hypothetical protein
MATQSIFWKGGAFMSGSNCEQCRFRAKYDKQPKSILGRLWRWHAGWCPGWRAYLKSLQAEDRERLIEKYRLKQSG